MRSEVDLLPCTVTCPGDAVSGEKKRWDGPGLEAWRAWSPWQVAEILAGVAAPWCVVGGWAAELAVGDAWRDHGDIEISIPRSYYRVMAAHLSGYRLHAVGDGEVIALAPGEMTPADKFQNWVLDEAAGAWRLDVMLEPGDTETWVCRRDETITAPRGDVVATRDGVPYLKPKAALLFKAKHDLEKNDADFFACLPIMDAADREWLAERLRVIHPGHRWIESLGP